LRALAFQFSDLLRLFSEALLCLTDSEVTFLDFRHRVDLMGSCCSREPEDRPSFSEVAEALELIVAHFGEEEGAAPEQRPGCACRLPGASAA
jgi:hypothetical protein